MLQRQLLLVSLMVLPAMSKTMELGRSGRPTMDDDDVGGAWSAAAAATYGVIDQRWSNCVALTWCAWLRSRNAGRPSRHRLVSRG